ncbi:MAG: hypothetical protein M5R40_25960 [Anaerolineae bacterium]|nr:hypothetical protein [Anaerolineae bacterium]
MRATSTAYLAWCSERGQPAFHLATLEAYKADLLAEGKKAATVNRYLSAVRALLRKVGQLYPEVREQAEITREVRSVRQAGARVGVRLSLDETQALVDAPPADTLRGRRDRALLAVLFGCLLRRRSINTRSWFHVSRSLSAFSMASPRSSMAAASGAFRPALTAWTRAACAALTRAHAGCPSVDERDLVVERAQVRVGQGGLVPVEEVGRQVFRVAPMLEVRVRHAGGRSCRRGIGIVHSKKIAAFWHGRPIRCRRAPQMTRPCAFFCPVRYGSRPAAWSASTCALIAASSGVTSGSFVHDIPRCP